MQLDMYIKMRSLKSTARSFTLIELMAVIAIIGILAGLVLGGAGAVRQRAARSQYLLARSRPVRLGLEPAG